MAELATAFERYAGWAADVTPLYETLANAVASDDELLAIAAAAPEGQPAPQLLLAAVHSLLLEGESHPLAAHYPTCREGVAGVGGGVDDTESNAGRGDDTGTADDYGGGNPIRHFRDFCLAHETELGERIRSRRVQTNDVGRSAVLLPAFTHVQRRTAPDSLALIELGASAGLNLNWDRYAYRYTRPAGSDVDGGGGDSPDGGGGGSLDGCGGDSPDAATVDSTGDADSAPVRHTDDADSPVTIRTEVRGDGEVPVPATMPSVEWRIGVDRNPLDPTDPADARWLHALVHPDQPDRHRRLDAALDVAGERPPPVVDGDAVEALPRLLAAAPRDAALVVFSTHFLYQLQPESVDRIRELLAGHSRYRSVDWLSIDPDAALGTPVYRRVAFRDGDATERQLAQFESYGDWLRWFGADLSEIER